VACPYIPPSRIAEFAEIGLVCFSLSGNLLGAVYDGIGDQAYRGGGGSVSKVAENCERLAKDGSRNLRAG